jgi:hypothetical protein
MPICDRFGGSSIKDLDAIASPRSVGVRAIDLGNGILTQKPWTLSIDRTDWQFGDCVFNILMLGVVYDGVAFPLVWCLLDLSTGQKLANSRRKGVS